VSTAQLFTFTIVREDKDKNPLGSVGAPKGGPKDPGGYRGRDDKDPGGYRGRDDKD
jgi:hypothetical protein